MKRSLSLALAGAALLYSLGSAAAQNANSAVRLILSSRPLAKAPKPDADLRANVLRPNVEQELFTYVQNDGMQAESVTVQLLAGGVEVAPPVKPVAVGPGKFEQIKWPRPAEAAAAKPTQLTGPVALRLLDAKGNPLGEAVKLIVDRPDNYLDATLKYFPPREGEPNRLVATVKVKPQRRLTGPTCRVQLVLDADHIPGLLAGHKKKGKYVGHLAAARSDKDQPKLPLSLTAEDIRLEPDRRSGVVSIQADDYNRAFTFQTDFPLSGTPSTPDPNKKETLRLNLPRFANPRNPVPVVIEADNLVDREDARLVLEAAPLLADKKEADSDQFSLLEEFRGERDVQLLLHGPGKNGGLRFVPQVKDWSKNLDLGGLHGRVVLRLRLLDKDGMELKSVRQTILLDETPPERVRIERIAKAVRGQPFLVRASGASDSGIRQVVFFVGRPQPDGKPPSQAIVVEGKPIGADKKEWEAELVVPVDQRGPLEVSARFTNGVGLSTTEVAALREVAEPPAVGVARRGSIAGVVTEGDRPQPRLPVDLLDAAGRVLISTKTDSKGAFIFKELAPGTYRVSSIKTASNTRGSNRLPIVLAAGENKTGVGIKLYRR